MSAYHEYETQFNDRESLIGALMDMGLEPEVYDTPVPLVGYEGSARKQKAEIVIRREQLGRLSNDLGFALQPDGTYRMIVSDYDERTVFGPKRVAELKLRYGERRAMKLAKAKGLKLSGREEYVDEKGNRRVRLVFARRQR